jgi:hypothetical protein
MEEFTKTFSIDFRSRNVLVKVNLRDVSGKSQYQLVCFSGDDAANAAAGGFIYSGGLLCGLGEARAPLMHFMENRSLLSEKTAAIYSRGNFHPSALVGPCANYPDFGAQRTFRLRGMSLELRVANVEVFPNYSSSFEFRPETYDRDREHFPIGKANLIVRLTDDPQATSPRALPSPQQDPRGNEALCKQSRN